MAFLHHTDYEVNMNENELTEEDVKDMIGIEQAAAMLPSSQPGKARHYATLYRWVKSGKIRGWKLGGRMHVLKRDVLALFKPVPTKISHPPRLPGAVELRRRAAYVNRMLDEAGI